MLKLSDSNSKLKKTAKILKELTGKKAKIFAFNLPAGFNADGVKVCIGAGDCLEVCYARQARYMMSTVKAPRENNFAELEAIYTSGGVDAVTSALVFLVGESKATHVRVHDSGDFFSSWYVKAWLSAMEQLSHVTFYAYTKSVPLFVGKAAKKLPHNFQLTFSYGGIWDKMIPMNAPTARIFTSHEDRIKAGYEDGNSEEYADALAIIGKEKIGLVYHGVKNLTAEQKVKFAA